MTIVGLDALTSRMGEDFSFHDCVVLRLTSDVAMRAISMSVHAFRLTDRVTRGGAIKLDRHCRVDLAFTGVTRADLNGWWMQNVISDLRIEPASHGVLAEIDAAVGLPGEVEADRLDIQLSRWRGAL